MKTLKILYIDTPFVGFESGDKNRSKFLYKALLAKFETDILLVENKEYSQEIISSHNKNNQLFTIKTKKQRFYKTNAIYDFHKKDLADLKKIIEKNSYDVCFFRFISTSVLADFIKQIDSSIKIIIDVDMLFSQISNAAWNQNKSIKNRYHFFEYLKLSYFENELFNKNYNFLYTNKNEIELVKNKYNIKNSDNHKVLVNVINEIPEKDYKVNKEKFILFYGVLNSTANISAYKFLIEKIYPIIKPWLLTLNIKIYIVGKNPTKIHENSLENIELIGEVNDVFEYIKNSMMVIFPLTVASGTLTRILEVAYLKKAIIATSRASSGLDLEGKIIIQDNENEIAKAISTFALDLQTKEKYENLAYAFVKENYSSEKIKNKLYSLVDKIYTQKRVLHIPRRFTTSHWGGTENVVLSIANTLKNHNIKSEILTTNILSDKKEEIISGINVKRFNYFYPYFNLSLENKQNLDLVGGNLFSWSLFIHLIFEKNIDLIHLHTAKRMGSIIRTICKIRKIPYLITIHGGLYDISSNERENRMEPTKNSFEWGKVLGFLFGSRRVYDDANAIITLNKNEYESVKKNYVNKDVYLLSNSIDVKAFQIPKDTTFKDRYNIPNDRFIFLVSARIDKQKNQLLALEALKELITQEINSHLLIVGNITNLDYFNEIKNYIKDNSLEKNTTIITDLKPNSEELINSYLNSDAFILPSLHEPFGIVGLEAWACSLPLIVSDICGICGIVKDEENALIFKNDSLYSLLSQMKNIITNNTLRQTLKVNASKEVQKYDDSVVNNTLFEIYKKAMVL